MFAYMLIVSPKCEVQMSVCYGPCMFICMCLSVYSMSCSVPKMHAWNIHAGLAHSIRTWGRFDMGRTGHCLDLDQEFYCRNEDYVCSTEDTPPLPTELFTALHALRANIAYVSCWGLSKF